MIMQSSSLTKMYKLLPAMNNSRNAKQDHSQSMNNSANLKTNSSKLKQQPRQFGQNLQRLAHTCGLGLQKSAYAE